ncbi:MAG: YbaB/EbfC family nucleoid-associated protein [Synergistales bacterium]|nr:YbaB/EbfC family nucleoid-associated protein [Synergistales bacterium]
MKMDKLLKQAQQMQAQMGKIQEELGNERVEGAAGGGMVKAIATGQGDLVDLTISPDVIDPEDSEMLEDLVLAAVSDALKKSKELSQERMGQVSGAMGGMNIPGLTM